MVEVAGALTDGQIRELVQIAVGAAKEGARIVTSSSMPVTTRVKSGPYDPVTETDLASQSAIRLVIAEARPDDAFVGEEADLAPVPGASSHDGEPRPGEVRWVVDPLDGTVNYLYGIRSVAVSVAAQVWADGWSPVAASVCDVYSGEIFSAGTGLGAWCNDRRLRVSALTELQAALVGTGFSYARASRARQARQLARMLVSVRDVRSTGSAALELCRVAAGRLDAYVEDELEPWDTAAGSLIVEEAGGLVVFVGKCGVIAGPPAIAKELCALLGSTEGSDIDDNPFPWAC